jgi:hypothetical protein
MGKAKGTNNADKITVNASEVIVVTGKKKPRKIAIAKSGKNTINGGAGKDTITINGGKSNYIYGSKGSDTFVISKKSTGTAIVKDFSNKEIVQVAGGTVKNIKGSGKDIIIYGGKKGKASLTLKNAKGKTFTVKDSSNIYTVTKGVVGVTLKKNFTGTFKAPSFVTTIDASKVVERNGIVVRGNDKGNTIKLKNGSWHEIYGGAGKDTITVIGGTNHEIQAGAGKDIITVTGGNSVNVYGDNSSYTTKGDNDTITVNGGKNIYVHGYGGNDVITVNDGTDLCIWGDDGTDTITVYGGSGHKINGGQEKDNIYIYGGTFKEIDCSGYDDGDKIIVSEKAQGGTKDNNAKIYGGAGGDTITVSAGTYYSIYGYVGDDKITLENSKTYAWVDGGDGKDTINVSNSKNTLIDGGGDDDTITVTGGTDNHIIDEEGNNYINAESLKSSGGGSAKIECSPGNDTITLTNCSGYNVNPGAGANKITINGGQKNIIFYDNYDYKGDDIIDIKGGTGHVVNYSYGGKVTVSGSGTTCDINIEQGNGSATLLEGKTTLNFCSYNSGKFTINAAKGTLTGDLITFKYNSSDQFTFGHVGSSTLTLTGKNGAGSLTIYNFTNGAFAGGIQFSDSSTPMSYDTIKTKAWLS